MAEEYVMGRHFNRNDFFKGQICSSVRKKMFALARIV
jgi:hypothetical protein